MANKYLFVDGAYLREVVSRFSEKFYGGTTIPIDYATLGGPYRKCFFYDCVSPIRGNEDETQYQARVRPEREQFSAIRNVDGWHVTEGVVVGVGGKARQKQVDIQIAVDMLTHSHRRNMDELDFIAGDQDFKPLVDALVRDGMFVKLLYEPTSASRPLIEAADARQVIDIRQVFYWTTQSFNRAHPFPRLYSSPGFERGAEPHQIEHGRTNSLDCDLFHIGPAIGGTFEIVHPDELNVGNHMHWCHADKNFLKLVFENMRGPVEWRDVPEAQRHA